MDVQRLLLCIACGRPLAPDDQVVMAVPYRERGELVVMGDELLVHEACGPLPDGVREVGRGRFDQIIEGIRSGPRPEDAEEAS